MTGEIDTSTSIEILTTDARHQPAWDDLVAAFGQRDIYFSRKFCETFAQYDRCVAQMFCWRDRDAIIIYPFFLRRIDSLAIVESPEAWDGYYDIVSPYGYSGPLARTVDGTADGARRLFARFLDAFHAHCVEHRIVCEFARLHPLFRNHLGLIHTRGLERHGEVVTIDLQQSEEAIWQGFSKENRKKIARALAHGITVRQVPVSEGIEEFTRLYHETMHRVRAREWYFFPENWLNDLHVRLSGNLSMFLAFAGENIVAGASVFHVNGLVNNFLSASDANHAHLSPNNLLFREIIRWARGQGYRWYNLGGGHRPGDGIMRFKLNFARQTADFYVYKKVHLREAFDRLVQEWQRAMPTKVKASDTSFFPLYRTPTPSEFSMDGHTVQGMGTPAVGRVKCDVEA